jgi:periplasmic protein TonB
VALHAVLPARRDTEEAGRAGDRAAQATAAAAAAQDGGTGGGGGDRFAWYGALLRERITDAILRDEKLRKAQDYQRVISVWVSASGAVTRVELVGAAQFPELDEALRNVLRGLPALREGAPGDMPQPIRLRVSARS